MYACTVGEAFMSCMYMYEGSADEVRINVRDEDKQ